MLLFLYKALNGLCNINIDSYIDFYSDADHYSFRKYDDLSLKKKYGRTNPLKYSFFPQIVDSWNLLPYDTRKAVNVNIFKWGVKKFLLNNTLNLTVFLCWIIDFISLLHYHIFIGDLFIMWYWTPLRIIHMAIYIIISMYYLWCH